MRQDRTVTSNNSSDSIRYIGTITAIVACSRIIFPSKADAQAIFDNATDLNAELQAIPISEEKFESILPSAIVAYNESTDNPKVISIDDEEVMYLDTLDIADDDRFWGMILQTVYYEFEMEDFRIRWYTNDCGDYKAKDVLVKRNSDSDWKFIYNRVHVDQSDPDPATREIYTIGLSDTRREDLFFWEKGNASSNPDSDTLTHIAIRFIQDWNDENSMGGSLNGESLLITFGKTSTQEAGGGFGRVTDDIIVFSISVIYQMGDPGASGTFGFMHNFEISETGKMKFSDLEQETQLAKQLYPIKSIEFEVEYDFAD
ncbi:MAG: hypothetical protein Q7J65_03485 [Candidatus Marinimicrobia bacterium]|nr:hypothetical protein [Candidatus Neomarinimicrobiota bacterium]